MSARIASLLLAGALVPAASHVAAQDHSHYATSQQEAAHGSQHDPQQAASASQEHAQHQVPAGHGPHPPTAPRESVRNATPAAQPPGHAAMDHAAMGHAMPPSKDRLVTPIPALTDADRAAVRPPSKPHPAHDNGIHSLVRFDRLEAVDADGGLGFEWDGQAWIGTDTDRLWLRTEGSRDHGHTRRATFEAMYGRPVAPWWDLLVGVRHDFKPGASQDFAAIGVTGMAPYKFEVEATAYVGSGGRTAARVELEYETLLTNRLVLQPVVELEFSGKEDARRGLGTGLTTVETGLRLRYEIVRRFAPYVGVSYERAFGGTAGLRAQQGRETSGAHVVAGVRAWF